VGYQVGYSNTTGAYNTWVGGLEQNNGNATGRNNTTGNFNTALGNGASALTTTGSNNTVVGYQAGYTPTTANENTFVGFKAGFVKTTGDANTFIGNQSGVAATTGITNTFLGASSGSSVTTGSKNTIIGSYNGNQSYLGDIRTLSNHIVLSDGDGVTGFWINASGRPFLPGLGGDAGTNAVRFNTGTYRLSYDTSSAKYKDNIRDSVYGLSHVMQMRSTMFEYKSSGRTDVGLIAEEVYPIIPELVGVLDDEPNSVSYDRMVSVLVKAIQELKAEFDAYKLTHP
jgi:hypothetical protein